MVSQDPSLHEVAPKKSILGSIRVCTVAGQDMQCENATVGENLDLRKKVSNIERPIYRAIFSSRLDCTVYQV